MYSTRVEKDTLYILRKGLMQSIRKELKAGDGSRLEATIPKHYR